MSSFTVVVIAVLVAYVAAKQGCPVCRESSGSFQRYGKDCDRALRSNDLEPCSEGKVCKLFTAGWSTTVGYSYYSTNIKKIDCYYPTDTCLSEFGVHFQCDERVLFSPDRCPSCVIAKGNIGGQDVNIEDNCNYDANQWGSCNAGYSCNFLKLRGYLGSGYSDSITVYVLGCGLTYSDCSQVESTLESTVDGLNIYYCTANDFPADWDS